MGLFGALRDQFDANAKEQEKILRERFGETTFDNTLNMLAGSKRLLEVVLLGATNSEDFVFGATGALKDYPWIAKVEKFGSVAKPLKESSKEVREILSTRVAWDKAIRDNSLLAAIDMQLLKLHEIAAKEGIHIERRPNKPNFSRRNDRSTHEGAIGCEPSIKSSSRQSSVLN